MNDRLQIIEKRYEEINEQLMDPQIVTDIKKLTAISKEQRQLEKIVIPFRKLVSLENSLEDLRLMKKDADPEISEMASIELEENLQAIENLNEELKILLLPKDPNDDKNVMVEIRGAAGGDEANIFAGDLFRMYSRYADNKGWKIDVLDAMPSDMGGYSQISFKITGDSIYSYMKFESGAHRVQRVPETESMGRIQTSTATVFVMPEASEIDFKLDPNELRFDTFCSSGPGGQSVNTTASAVRVTHIPTGYAVASQVHKSQHDNKAAAIELLAAKLYNELLQKQQEEAGTARKASIGTGERSEKIRTYNYPQSRVTDHRIGFTINRLDAVIDGKLDLVIQELINEDQKQKLNELNGQ